MSRAITQTPEYRTGTNAELKLQRWLINRGHRVARVGHHGDVAPALRGAWDALALPDLQVFLRGAGLVWCEVKHKETCGYYRVLDARTTGIDESSYFNYLRVEGETGYPVYVVFMHREQNEVRYATLEKQRGWFAGAKNGAAMRYVRYDGLPVLCTYREVMALPSMPARFDEPLFGPATEDEHQIQLSLSFAPQPKAKAPAGGPR